MLIQHKVIIAAAVEITYAVFTRLWLRRHLDGVQLELAVSAMRVVTLVLYWGLFRRLVRNKVEHVSDALHPLLVAGVLTTFAVPALFQGGAPGGGFDIAAVSAMTSAIVGLREEFLYRAVLINLLLPRIGLLGALVVSTFMFVVYHYGAQPFTGVWLTESTCMSFILGLIYVRHGSLLLVASIHAIYDAIWCFGPYLDAPLEDKWRPIFLFAALGLVVAWWRIMSHSSLQRTHFSAADRKIGRPVSK